MTVPGPVPDRTEAERWGRIDENDERCLELALPAHRGASEPGPNGRVNRRLKHRIRR